VVVGSAEPVVFGTAVLAVVVRSAEPVVFETAVLVVVFGMAKSIVLPSQVQLLHWFLHTHTYTCLQLLS
jgi:hypothetical protein